MLTLLGVRERCSGRMLGIFLGEFKKVLHLSLCHTAFSCLRNILFWAKRYKVFFLDMSEDNHIFVHVLKGCFGR